MADVMVGIVKGLAPVDAQGQPTLLGVGAPKNSKSGKARLLQVQVGPALKTVQLVTPAGEDFSPPDGSVILLIGDGWKYGFPVRDDVPPDPNLNPGEWIARATDGSGTKRGRVKLKQNGKVYVGNATQNLRTQLDNLLQALNTFCGSAAQSAISTGGSSSAALAAAIVALMIPLFNSVVSVTTAIDALLDTTE
jgi:hypothetical protein